MDHPAPSTWKHHIALRLSKMSEGRNQGTDVLLQKCSKGVILSRILFFLWGLGPHTAVLRNYSRLCAMGSLLAEFRRTNVEPGMEPGYQWARQVPSSPINIPCHPPDGKADRAFSSMFLSPEGAENCKTSGQGLTCGSSLGTPGLLSTDSRWRQGKLEEPAQIADKGKSLIIGVCFLI